MVSIYDIAKAAGVSAATVSRALRGSTRVSLESRERIRAIANELGYRPNILARNLRSQSTNMVGLVVDDVSDEFASLIIKGVEDETRTAGYHLIVWSAHKNAESERTSVQTFTGMQVAGIIMADTWTHSTEELPDTDVPTVFVNRRHTGTKSFYVGPDDQYGAYLATIHLLELGHTRIGYISGPLEWRASPERLRGFQMALRDKGVIFDPELVGYGDWSMTSGDREARKLLSRPNPPTALFMANDYMAVGAMDAAGAMSIRIPETLSVIGYDNRGFSSFCRPRLTTVSLPLYEMGVEAAKLLLKVMQDRDLAPVQVAVRGRLFLRESTAAPHPGE